MAQTGHKPDRLAHAMEAHRAGAFAAAEAGYRRVLTKDRHARSALSGLGVLLVETGRALEAVRPLGRLVQLAPDGDAWFALGVAKARSGDGDGALVAFGAATRLSPNHLGAWNNLAGLLQAQGAVNPAADTFARALVLDPALSAVLANLALVTSIAGFEGAALRLAHHALAIDPVCPQAAIIQARLCADDQIAACQRMLAQLCAQSCPPDLAAGLWFASAHLAQAAGDTPDVITALGQAHHQARQSPSWQRARPDRLSRRIDALEAQAGSAFLIAPEISEDDGSDLVFIVGFPRSGTTLIEQRLAASGKFYCSDENSPLAHLLEIDPRPDIATLRRRYRAAIPQDRAGRRYVDKLPLNILELPLIARLFPAARIIVALRDPRDVIWSCWAQDFEWNDATVHFGTLSGIAGLYTRVMSLWAQYEGHLSDQCLVVRYEDLVGAPSPQIDRLGQYLGVTLTVDGTPAIRAISTPSRHRVRQGFKTDAIGRWRSFRDQLAPYLDQLGPLIARFGYPAD
jgi:Flp pilus assembly protein TadD